MLIEQLDQLGEVEIVYSRVEGAINLRRARTDPTWRIAITVLTRRLQNPKCWRNSCCSISSIGWSGRL